MAEKTELCAHAGRRCSTPAGGDYCSDYCSLNENDLETVCRCGHPECQITEPITLDLGAVQRRDVDDASADGRGEPEVDRLRVDVKERQQSEYDFALGDSHRLLDASALCVDIVVRSSS